MNYGSIFYVDIQKKLIFVIYPSLMLLGESMPIIKSYNA